MASILNITDTINLLTNTWPRLNVDDRKTALAMLNDLIDAANRTLQVQSAILDICKDYAER